MSAYATAYIRCDHFNPDAPPGETKFCPRNYDSDARPEGETKAKARAAARKLGWAYVRSPLGRWNDKDYCPDHKPQEG